MSDLDVIDPATARVFTQVPATTPAQTVVGDGFAECVDRGPVRNAPQLERVRGLLADTVDRGADVWFRGEAPDVPIVADEQIGPAAVLRIKRLEVPPCRSSSSPTR